MRRQSKRKKSVRFAPKTVDCPSDAAANGDTDRFGSKRAWENSQRGYPFYRCSKSYLPTHGVFHKKWLHFVCFCRRNLRVVRRGKAGKYGTIKSSHEAQPACGTPRQSAYTASRAPWAAGATCVWYAEAKQAINGLAADGIGATCVWYAEAKVCYAGGHRGRCGRNLRVVRRGKGAIK